MDTVPLLDELAIVAVVGAIVTVVLAKLRLPTVAGRLAAGAIVGPLGLGLATSVHDIEALAEAGVVLLLFTIGLEFSLARLRDISQQLALGGLLQVCLTTIAVATGAHALGQSAPRAIVYGFVFALSSTAIVLRALGDRQELEAPHGRFIVGTLVFKDLCVVPMVLVVLLLGEGHGVGQAAGAIGVAMAKAAFVVVVTVVVARLVVPRFLDWVDASRSREVFLLAILGLCIGTAHLTALAGLLLALGAFLAGMLVADTEYGRVSPESPAVGRSPVALRLRSATGALVVGLDRGGSLLDPLDPHEPFAAADVVFVVGASEALRAGVALFDGASDSATDENPQPALETFAAIPAAFGSQSRADLATIAGREGAWARSSASTSGRRTRASRSWSGAAAARPRRACSRTAKVHAPPPP